MIPHLAKQNCELTQESQMRLVAKDLDSARASSLFCPYCGYDLSGQVEPRCPECGYRYAWEDLKNPQRRIHPYLYEHHPERGFMSFWKTMFASWRPRAFWKSVSIEHPVSTWRLLRYQFAVFAMAVLIVSASSLRDGFSAFRGLKLARQTSLRYWNAVAAGQIDKPGAIEKLKRYGTPQMVVDAERPHLSLFQACLKYGLPTPWALSICPAWTVLTLAAICLFFETRRRARANFRHLLRSLVYTSDAALWIVAGGLAIIVFRPYDKWIVLIIVLSLFCVAAFRLSCALGAYLRFERPFIVAATSQIFVMLAWICIRIAYHDLTAP